MVRIVVGIAMVWVAVVGNGGGLVSAEDQARQAGSTAAVPGADAPQPPDDGKLKIIVFGAHPDDAEIRAGGTARLWADLGHHVHFVSMTNGDIGHWQYYGPQLAQRRFQEVTEAAKLLGTTSSVLDIHDGELVPSLENRRIVTRYIRRWKADIVIAHRTNDYHPDHRYTGVLVQDSAYMVTVPFFCPEVPYLRDNPVFLSSYDGFQRPNPFRPDIVVAIDRVIDQKVEALLKMESQFVEGGANGYRNPALDEAAKELRRRAAAEGFRRRFADIANRCRDRLIELYGEEEGRKVQYAEAFEICEYGRQPSREDIKRLFPFIGSSP